MSKKVLIVEDNELNMKLFRDLLEAHGIASVSTSNGHEVLELARKEKPDLILMDVMMPHMDGPTTLTHFKKMDCAKDIPVIFMTAKAQVHEQAEYKALGAIGVLVKPFDPMTLCEDIERLWQHR